MKRSIGNNQNAFVTAEGRHARWSLLAGVMAVALLITLVPSEASSQQLPCGITQITHSTGEFFSSASISADGTRLAITSSANLAGENPDGSYEIFLYDTPTGSFTQITHSSDFVIFPTFSFSADGTHIAFVSNADLTGENADSNFEVFLYDAAASSFKQITRSTGLGAGYPSISADGMLIAFTSGADLTGENSDGSSEVFLYDRPADIFTQITHSTSDSSSALISGDGSLIAFTSKADPTSKNSDGNLELFIYDRPAAFFTQITNTTGSYTTDVSFSADGKRLAFSSNADFAGANADSNFEIFLYDTKAGSFTQITDSTGDGSFSTSISADGTRIAFVSNRDLTGKNFDGNYEIFLYDTQTNSLTQITDTTGGDTPYPSISADGTRMAISSSADLTGENPDGNREVFLASCPSAQPPGVSELNDLSSLLAGLNLSNGTSQSLSSKIEEALLELQTGNVAEACGTLNALINEVRAQEGKKKITAQQAEQLISSANEIRALLGCR